MFCSISQSNCFTHVLCYLSGHIAYIFLEIATDMIDKCSSFSKECCMQRKQHFACEFGYFLFVICHSFQSLLQNAATSSYFRAAT